MNKKIFGFISFVVVIMLAFLIVSVSATKPMHISGSITVIPSPPQQPEMAGESDNGIVAPVSDIVFAGDITGTGIYSGRWVMHNIGDPQSIWVNAKGNYEIEATVDGKSGTLYLKACSKSGSGKPSTWRIVGGTEELEGLHGQGTFTAVDLFNYNYVGQVHFDP
jgi:hypothetical protein